MVLLLFMLLWTCTISSWRKIHYRPPFIIFIRLWPPQWAGYSNSAPSKSLGESLTSSSSFSVQQLQIFIFMIRRLEKGNHQIWECFIIFVSAQFQHESKLYGLLIKRQRCLLYNFCLSKKRKMFLSWWMYWEKHSTCPYSLPFPCVL